MYRRRINAMKARQNNQYDGCLDQWKVDLALARIRAFRIPRDEWPDAQQRLALTMLRFQFDPQRGAKESTALCRIINNQLASMLRSRRRAQTRLARHQAQTERDGRLIYEDSIALRLDVRLVVAELPLLERRVCAALMQGDSVPRIASRLGRSCPTVRRIIARIRRRFKAIDLDAWVGSR
jgi:DNA-directed RNA polymerase specialized sigma24 family protein